MRISDWSSDVCSSDLGQGARAAAQATLAARGEAVTIGAIGQKPRDLDMDAVRELGARERCALGNQVAKADVARNLPFDRNTGERRVGDGCGSPCRLRWSK